MRQGSRRSLLAVGSALVTVVLVGVSAASSPDVPKGPFIDFCPTVNQVEAHFEEYGFDYKPTVSCGEDGTELAGPNVSEGDDVLEAEMIAQEKDRLLRAKRGPEADGDPTTLEVIFDDGTESVIFIETTMPELFDGMTPAEFAERYYP